MTYYIYWNGENTPDELPEGCEFYSGSEWFEEVDQPSVWRGFRRRWPAPEHVYRTTKYCEAYGIEVPDGWEVVDFCLAEDGDMSLFTNGKRHCLETSFQVPILRKVESKWLEGDEITDEIAKLRPKCQGRQLPCYEWKDDLLYGVDSTMTSPFICRDMYYGFCRVLREDVEKAGKEAGE